MDFFSLFWCRLKIFVLNFIFIVFYILLNKQPFYSLESHCFPIIPQKKRVAKPRQAVEMGTQNSDIDYDWIPKETLQSLSKLCCDPTYL